MVGQKKNIRKILLLPNHNVNKYGGDSLYFFDRIVLDEQGNIVAINEQPFD